MRAFLKKHILWYMNKTADDAIDSYAAQSAFWILISFIPFVLFVLTLLQLVRFEDTTMLMAATNLLPAPVRDLLQTLFNEMRAPQGVLSMTAIVCVWSASSSMVSLIKGLYSIFDVPKRHNFVYMRILAILYTLALVIILLVSIGLLVFGDMLFDWLKTLLPAGFAGTIRVLKPFMGFAVLLLLFWLMFIAIPRKQVRLRNAFWGAAFAAAGWVLFSFFFSIFVENFSNYATIYGSLAAIVILMMWLFICMYILLIGGEVAMWLQNSGIRADLKQLRRQRKKQKNSALPVKGTNQHGKTNQK